MERKRRFGHIDSSEPQVNITPLIDVVFVLLISFIVVAPLLEIDRIQLANASEHQSQKHAIETSSIQIHVHEDNSVTYNKRLVSISELPSLLQEAKYNNPNAKPQLFHDKNAYFGTYQKIKNILEGCGFQELDVVLSP